jgi:hypothetical protein
MVGLLQRVDVKPHHLHHGFHNARGFVAILIVEHLWQDVRDDLPRDAKCVLQPATLHRRAAVRDQDVPQPVDFGVVLTRDDQRHRVVEAVVRSAVERVILLSGERAIDEEGFACCGTRRVDACAQHPIDARVEKNRRIKLHGLFRLAIEPEAW